MSLNKESSVTYAVRIAAVLMAVVLVRQWYSDIINFPSVFPDVTLYESFGVSDWLINYQGGFVRRGLAGELLYLLYQIHPYSVVYLIAAISVLSLAVLFAATVWLFRKMGWPIWLLLFPMFFYYRFYGLGYGAIDSRRDAIMMLLAISLYMAFKKSMAHGGWYYFGVWLLTILIMLLHEGMLFTIFPILIVYTWYLQKDQSFGKKLSRSILVWWPLPIVLTIVTLFHGSTQTAECIWNSWFDCFERYPLSEEIPAMGLGVEWLSMSVGDALKTHLDMSWGTDFVAGIPIWPFNIYLLIAIYYLMTRMGFFNSGKREFDPVLMSNIVILETLFTLPMLGFVACDWYRSIPYYCILSCFLYYVFPQRNLFPNWLTLISDKVQGFINRSFFLSSPWTYCTVLLFLPFLHHNARIGGLFPFIPLDMKHELLEMFLV